MSTAGHLFLHTFPTQHLFCDSKLLKSTAGHLFLDTLLTRHLFYDRKLVNSTAGPLFLHTLPTRHLFCSRKIWRIHITTTGHRGFGLIAPGCRACRHREIQSVSTSIPVLSSRITSTCLFIFPPFSISLSFSLMFLHCHVNVFFFAFC